MTNKNSRLALKFNVTLFQVGGLHHVVAKGVHFPLECLNYYDLEKGTIVLRDGFTVSRREGSDSFIFRSPHPFGKGYIISVYKSQLTSVVDLSDGEIFYSSTA